jgi:hypothetical protein
MNRPISKMRELSERLLNHEARAAKLAGASLEPGFDACEKLRPHLASFMGIAGFRALLSRAVALAGGSVPWLRAIHVRADGSLEGLAEFHQQLAPEELFEGRAVLLTHILELLVAFIGGILTVRLVHST